MPIATGNGTPTDRFASNAPAATPGQSRYPPTTNAASEMPVGGQTGVATPFAANSDNPARAVTKYVTNRMPVQAQRATGVAVSVRSSDERSSIMRGRGHWLHASLPGYRTDR